jgi:hypothetical protein
MYSITNSPVLAVDLAHAIQDEHLRHARSNRRTPKRPRTEGARRPHWWPSGPWARPAVA